MLIKSDYITHCPNPGDSISRSTLKYCPVCCFPDRSLTDETILTWSLSFFCRLQYLMQPAGGVPASPQSDFRKASGVTKAYSSHRPVSNIFTIQRVQITV